MSKDRNSDNNCNYCESKKLIKKGLKNGKQAYQCKACSRYSFKDISNSNSKQKKIIVCKFCNDYRLIRYGKKNNKQCYLCMNCNTYAIQVKEVTVGNR